MVVRGGAADDIHHLRDGLLNSPGQFGWTKMDDITSPGSAGKGTATTQLNSEDQLMISDTRGSQGGVAMLEAPARYQVYKIRWFGLVQLVLLNVVISWDVSFTMRPMAGRVSGLSI